MYLPKKSRDSSAPRKKDFWFPGMAWSSDHAISCSISSLRGTLYLYDLVLGKQGLHIQVLQIGERVRMDGSLLCEQCPNPDLRQFLHRLVGNTSQTQESHFV